MPTVLNAPERDKAVYALRDIKGILEYTRNKPEFKDLDEIQVILAGYGLQIAPIPKPAPLVLAPSVAPTAAAPASPSALSLNDANWIQDVIEKYRHAKRNNVAGFNFKNDAVGRLLHILCKPANIPFNL